MATDDIIREAAQYLEYFLKGLSECNVIGNYAVQFLELRGFSIRLEASLASHLIRLLTNMKGLLLKLDTSLIPFCHVEVQTEETVLCSLCNSQSSLGTTFKTNPLQDTKPAFEETAINKTYESPAVTQLFNTAPLIQLKQEMPCMDHTATSRIEQCNRKELDTNIIHIESLDSKESLKLREHTASSDTKNEKCNDSLPFQNALDGNINLEYASTSQLEEGQGEILLDHMEGSDTAASEGLMYSVYTMGSCGSLQLVSRILSKSNMVKDSFNEPVEKAMIEINNMKEELGAQDPIVTPHLQSDSVQNEESSVVNQEEMRTAPPSPGYEGKSYPKILSKNFKPSKSPPSKIAEVTACGSILTDIVKLGPEDLGSATWCRMCEKEFPSIGSLKVHVSRIHNQVKWCNTCNKIINSEDMRNHVRECHSDLQFVCNVCGQSLRNNGAYQRHMDIHKGLRGSACEICGQTFSRTEYYREHKRIHTGEKPFKCETCKKTFSRSSNLYTHMRIHNTEEQRHMCNICLKSFARADKLKDHMIRHLQIKRYACRMCSKSYNERRDLVKHLDKIHSNDDNFGTD